MGMQRTKKPIGRVRLNPKMVAHQFEPGHSGNPKGAARGTTLYQAIQKTLDDRAPNGMGSRRDQVADSFVKAAEAGSFIHAHAIIEREEGKVPQRMANADGSNLKMYDTMPTDGEEAP